MFVRKEKVNKYLGLCLVLALLSPACSVSRNDDGGTTTGSTAAGVAAEKYTAYLFTYFTGNRKDEEAIRFALSTDGYILMYDVYTKGKYQFPSQKTWKTSR